MVPEVSGGHVKAAYRHTFEVSVVVPRPNRRPSFIPLLRDVIAGLNVEPRRDLTPKNETELLSLAIAKFLAHKVTDVVITNAEIVHPSDLTQLALLTTSTGVRFTLMYGIDAGERVREWGESVEATDIEWSELSLPRPRNNEYVEHARSFPEVPDEEFVLFRASCRAVLTETEYEIVNSKYVDTFRFAQNNFTNSEIDTTDNLTRLILMCTSESEALTALRAYQSAYLKMGYFIKVDKYRLFNMTLKDPRRPYSPSEWQVLREMFDTQTSAIAALTQDYGASNPVHTMSLRHVMTTYSNPIAKQIHKRHRIYRMLTSHSEGFFAFGSDRWIKKTGDILRGLGLPDREPFSTPPTPSERARKLKLQIIRVIEVPDPSMVQAA
jgi:hypothetical protein